MYEMWNHQLLVLRGIPNLNNWLKCLPLQILMDDQPKECRLFLCLSFMADAIPPRGGAGRNFIPPLVRDWLLEGNFFSNPFPPFIGQVSEEGGGFWPPPTSRVEKKMIMFPKEQVDVSFVETSSKPIKFNTY